jgi:hypothetical protein
MGTDYEGGKKFVAGVAYSWQSSLSTIQQRLADAGYHIGALGESEVPNEKCEQFKDLLE